MAAIIDEAGIEHAHDDPIERMRVLQDTAKVHARIARQLLRHEDDDLLPGWVDYFHAFTADPQRQIAEVQHRAAILYGLARLEYVVHFSVLL